MDEYVHYPTPMRAHCYELQTNVLNTKRFKHIQSSPSTEKINPRFCERKVFSCCDSTLINNLINHPPTSSLVLRAYVMGASVQLSLESLYQRSYQRSAWGNGLLGLLTLAYWGPRIGVGILSRNLKLRRVDLPKSSNIFFASSTPSLYPINLLGSVSEIAISSISFSN